MRLDLLNAFYIGFIIAKRNICSLYRQSFLGIAWAFIPPILMGITFHFAAQAKIIQIEGIMLPYTVYVMLGTALWQTFAEAVTIPLKNLSQYKNLLSRVNFPRESLIISGILEVTFNFFIKLALFAVLLLYYDIQPGFSIIVFPIVIISLILTGSLVGIFLAPFSLLYHDVSRAVPIVLGFWMLITPIVYLPPTQGAFSTLVSLNPVTPYIIGARELLTGNSLTMSFELMTVSALTVFVMFFAWIVFRISFPYAVERVSA